MKRIPRNAAIPTLLVLALLAGPAPGLGPAPGETSVERGEKAPGEKKKKRCRGKKRRKNCPPKGESSTSAPAVCASGTALSKAEVEALLRAGGALTGEPATLAAVDRAGRVLGIYRKPGAPPAHDEEAVGLARTAAFFSNDQAPLSSRTVRHVSGIHFPPGIPNTPNAALYGIENTNRGCELDVTFLPGQDVPPARSVFGGPCRAGATAGCGPGPVTGKYGFDSAGRLDPQPTERLGQGDGVNPGGIPIYRNGSLAGGLGVAGLAPDAAEFTALGAVFSQAGAGLSPIPNLPLAPRDVVVFIDGIALPFARNVDRPAGLSAGADDGSFALGPADGGCIPVGHLIATRAGTFLSKAEVELIVQQAIAAAERTRAVIRLPPGERARMVFAVGDVDGEILALYRMGDATVFSIDVAAAKSRNVVYFSDGAGNAELGLPAGTAVSNRTINFGSQPLFPAGIDGSGPGPFFDLFERDLQNPCSQGLQPANSAQNGVVFFAGSIPLYSGGQLVGGLGVSGDGVEQDDYVAFLGAEGFRPAEDRWADRVKLRGVRLPFLKFPRHPER